MMGQKSGFAQSIDQMQPIDFIYRPLVEVARSPLATYDPVAISKQFLRLSHASLANDGGSGFDRGAAGVVCGARVGEERRSRARAGSSF
jgi:hypothetical protein